MRSVIWLVLLCAIAAVAATLLGANDGLLSVYWGGWRADVSLNFALLILLVAWLALFAVGHAIRVLLAFPQRARSWRARRRVEAAQAALHDAVIEFWSGRLSRALKAAQRAHQLWNDRRVEQESALRGLSVLAPALAAWCAHRLQDRAARDRWLSLAREAHAQGGPRGAAEALALMEAEWALDDHHAAGALALLDQLPPGVARRTQTLRLRLKAQRFDRQSLAALHTARLLAKHQAFTPEVARSLLRALACDALDRVATSAEGLRRGWFGLEVADRSDVLVACHAADLAERTGQPDWACDWLRPHWQDLAGLEALERQRLAHALARSGRGAGAEWLALVESAQREHPGDGAIARAAASVYWGHQLWGKAASAHEQAASSPDLTALEQAQACLRLAELARRKDDTATELETLRRAASLLGST